MYGASEGQPGRLFRRTTHRQLFRGDVFYPRQSNRAKDSPLCGGVPYPGTFANPLPYLKT